MREIIYAGIGSRETPEQILKIMSDLAFDLATLGFTLRSGRAIGADTAFETGAQRFVHAKKEIFIARDANDNPAWFEHAARFHPAWNKLAPFGKMLHARNSAIMLGKNLIKPVEFVVCWTANGLMTGGTSQALRIAEALEIPVFNLYRPKRLHDLHNYLEVLNK